MVRSSRYYENALNISQKTGDRDGEATWAWNLGLLHQGLGNTGLARNLMQITVDYERSIGHSDVEKHARRLGQNDDQTS